MKYEIKEDMSDFLKANPGLKYTLFGGKGGVGKTVMAATTALWLSEQGNRVLLTSTNPVHSLTGLLLQDVFGKETLVKGTKSLYALEIDTKDTIKQKKEDIREKVEWFLKYADITGTRVDDFVESATMNPSFEESAMFENMVDLMFADKYDNYVFDTAPTANARRLLGMSKVFELWVEKMIHSREDAEELKKKLAFTKERKEEKDPLSDYLLKYRDRINKIHGLLTDKDLTAFFFVTLPEALPIAVIKRFIGWFKDFGIPVGGVVVNEVIDKKAVTDKAPEFVLNRIKMQDKYMDEIFSSMSDVRAIVPYLDREVQGVDMLQKTSRYLFQEGRFY